MENDFALGAPNTLSLPFLEALYADYLEDPFSVPAEYREYFESIDHDPKFARTPRVGPSFKTHSVFNPPAINGHAAPAPRAQAAALPSDVSDVAVRQDRLDALVRAYRVRGHMIAKIDPLGLPRASQPELDPEFYGLFADDLERKFSSRTIFGAQSLTLREI
jgi:2-oxoglutarate dehydrogenase E1 component